MSQQQQYQDALTYHSSNPKGKLAVVATKKVDTQADLSLAYSPGVAAPCLEIAKDKQKIYEYTNRSNMMAVITDGSAVLGLGDIGAHASMPVMEGKCILLKKFAAIDAVPISVRKYSSVDEFVQIITAIDSSFGAINLEDIKAPICFEVEEKAIADSEIPVFHDDQHGTAIISTAGLLNALEIVGKKVEDARIVINGAGAAAIASAKMYIAAGVNPKKILMADSNGLIYKGREVGMNKYKDLIATSEYNKAATLAQIVEGADVLVGLSVAGAFSAEMIASMSKDPIIFALANPEPEIRPEIALKAGAMIMATGRSDYPNQVNNVLGFPGIFRAALDTRASQINTEMKMAAAKALRDLTKEAIPANIASRLTEIYPDDGKNKMFESGLAANYIIPKPFDERVVPRVAREVAKAAIKSGVAQIQIEDFDKYEREVGEFINL